MLKLFVPPQVGKAWWIGLGHPLDSLSTMSRFGVTLWCIDFVTVSFELLDIIVLRLVYKRTDMSMSWQILRLVFRPFIIREIFVLVALFLFQKRVISVPTAVDVKVNEMPIDRSTRSHGEGRRV